MQRRYKIAAAFVMLALWLALIFYFSSQNADASSEESGRLLEFLRRILSGIEFFPHVLYEVLLRKSAHFLLYFVLGLLAYNSIGRLEKASFLTVFAFCVLYAVSDEFHQYFVPGRSCEIRDVLIDSGGALIGILIFKSACFIKKSVLEHKTTH